MDNRSRPTMRDNALVGTLLDGRYRVTRRIDRGGMATVYLATDERLEREVAVKVMHDHLADDEQFVARFIREAKSAARIAHPNVVAVFDQGETDDVVYLVMEYVHGTTLRDVLNRYGALTAGQALEVLTAVLAALGAAHRAGLVHRDMKPENVLLTDDSPHGFSRDGIKVADFGLAKANTASRQSAPTGPLMGTADYLPPELMERGIADERSDVYAVGIMLFEMLTGRPPFDGDVPQQVAYQHVTHTVPAPSSIDSGIPHALDDLVAMSTAQDPDRRPRDASEFGAAVRRVRSAMSQAELDRRPAAARAGGDHVSSAPRRQATRVVERGPRTPTLGTPAVSAPVAGRAPARFPAGPGVIAAGPDFVPGRTPRADTGTSGSRPGAGRPPATRPRRRIGPAVIALLLLLTTIGGAGAWYLTAGPGAYTTTPTVTGTREDADRTLTAAGFTPRFSTAYNEEVKAGNVVSTDPAAGKRIRKRATVDVVVSKGTAWTTMPDVVGKTLAQATRTLTTQDIKIGANPQSVYDDKVPNGSVVSTQPAPKAKVKHGDTVTVVLSKGPAPVDVPDVTTQPIADATKTLTGLGLKVKTTQEYSEQVEQGKVISQNPQPTATTSTQAKRGDTITLVVSLGPPLVDVPSVVGKQADEAKSILQQAGFQVYEDKFMGGYFGTVRSQNPAGGSKAPKGSTITITIV